MLLFFFFFNDTATTEIYTLSLHDALPISPVSDSRQRVHAALERGLADVHAQHTASGIPHHAAAVCWACTSRSEEHTSELQSLAYLVCRLLLEKKKKKSSNKTCRNTKSTVG